MKTVALYRPNAIRNTLSDFDRYFDSFFGDSLLASATKIFNYLPPVDIQETETAYTMDMELPGYDEKDIEIHVDDSTIFIAFKHEDSSCEKQDANDEKQGTWILRERRAKSFRRSFKLPENADPEAVNAVFKNGVLSLEIKKRAEAQKRMIQINAN